MKRLARIICNSITVLSLLVCATTVALWVRSYWRDDAVRNVTENRLVRGDGQGPDSDYRFRAFGIESTRGKLLLFGNSMRFEGIATYIFTWPFAKRKEFSVAWHRDSGFSGTIVGNSIPLKLNAFGCCFEQTNSSQECSLGEIRGNGGPRTPGMTWATGNTRLIVFPHWMLALALAIYPARFFIRLGRRKPLKNHCAVCGYDLCATPDRCPECGTIPLKATV